MLIPITIPFEEIPRLKDLAKVVEVKQSAIVLNMYDAIVQVETVQDAQELYVAGREMNSPKRA